MTARISTVNSQYLSRLFAVFTVLLGLAQVCHGDTVLLSARYYGEHSGFKVKALRQLILRDQGDYLFRSTIKHTIGSVVESSTFSLKDGNILPNRYDYKQKILGFGRRSESIDFDWQKGLAVWQQRKGKKTREEIHKTIPGLLDPSLYQIQLQRDYFHASDTLAPEFEYQIVRRQRIRTLPFTTGNTETIAVGKKKYSAVKIRYEDQERKKMTTVWLVPALNYQIGKIQHRDKKGKEYSLYLQSYEVSDRIFESIYPTQANAKNLKLDTLVN